MSVNITVVTIMPIQIPTALTSASSPALIADRVPTHIITGFLGAGKTTLLKQLFTEKPAGEVWAVLVNEFGQIGLDGTLMEADAGIAIHEVAGGCLCCTSQLPMQIGLARLLTRAKPTRLFIEPTGLGHPVQLIEQLTEPHWQRALDLLAVVCVVDGTRLTDEKLTQHETYQAQWMIADLIYVSHDDEMSSTDHAQLQQMQARLETQRTTTPTIVYAHSQAVTLALIDHPRLNARQVKRSLLHLKPNTAPLGMDDQTIEVTLPYHYHEQAMAQSVGGWRLPEQWVFDRDRLLMWLLSLQDWMRIKGVLRVASDIDGVSWIALNLIPGRIGFNSHSGAEDNRLEIITTPGADWAVYEAALMACRVA